MQSDVKLYEPIAYSGWLLLVGVALSCLVVLWLGFVFWHTRKKSPKTLSAAKPKKSVLPDIPALQHKYLALIDELESAYAKKEISARDLHQKLSILLRFFVYEAKGIRAPVLTLSDLKMTSLKSVTEAVEQYYSPEFEAVSHGNVEASIAKAREVVASWS